MADGADAFYHPVGQDEFESSDATTSPWDESMQHGGPPAALLARAVELVRPDPEMFISRITTDMLGPIPKGRIVTDAQIVRPGKRVELVEAKLWANGRLAVTATAWRERGTPGSTRNQARTVSVPPLPGEQEQEYFPGISPTWGYGRAIEWRFVHGSLRSLGPADVWTRLQIPLVAGEDTPPVARLAIVADSANGISAEVPQSDWAFIPPTLTLTLARPPAGDWIHLSAQTVIADSGTGISYGELGDRDGFFGTVNQPLLVSPRL